MATRIIPKRTARWLPHQWHLIVTVIHPHQRWMKVTLFLRMEPHRTIMSMELAKQTRLPRQQTKPKTGMKYLIMKMPSLRAKTNLSATKLNKNPKFDIYRLTMISLTKYPRKTLMKIVPTLLSQPLLPLKRIRQTLNRRRRPLTAASLATTRVWEAESSLRTKLPTLKKIKVSLMVGIRRPRRVHPHQGPLLLRGCRKL
jgi:hypothetical protein